VQFILNQMVDSITFGKSFYHFIPVLPYPFDDIRGDADIEGAVSFTRKNINGGLLIRQFVLLYLDSGFRRNDEGRDGPRGTL
jgi:hypothetical protein